MPAMGTPNAMCPREMGGCAACGAYEDTKDCVPPANGRTVSDLDAGMEQNGIECRGKELKKSEECVASIGALSKREACEGVVATLPASRLGCSGMGRFMLDAPALDEGATDGVCALQRWPHTHA